MHKNYPRHVGKLVEKRSGRKLNFHLIHLVIVMTACSKKFAFNLVWTSKKFLLDERADVTRSNESYAKELCREKLHSGTGLKRLVKRKQNTVKKLRCVEIRSNFKVNERFFKRWRKGCQCTS